MYRYSLFPHRLLEGMTTKPSRIRRWIDKSAATLGLALIVLLMWGASPYWTTIFYPSYSTFSPQNWQQSHTYNRLLIAWDFLQNTSFKKSTRHQIISQLGRPNHDNGHQIDYFLSTTTADFMLLTFTFDDKNQVLKAYIHQS